LFQVPLKVQLTAKLQLNYYEFIKPIAFRSRLTNFYQQYFTVKSNSLNHRNTSSVKTDSIFYRLFQELPEIFFELIGNPPQTAEGYKFSSIEIKQTTFRIDGVFLPTKGKKILFILLKSSFKPTQKFIRA
jgi:hypothetical protein